MRMTMGFIACLALMVASIPMVLSDTTQPSGKVTVDLYVMSQCPFGVQAENLLIPAVESLAPHAQLKLHLRSLAPKGPDE